ncbi:unnamed protein product [Rotaria sp. Silwood1]|nr:unnamed protein product [Rotaria sp. Silwood1]
MQSLIITDENEANFLGQVSLDIKSLVTFEREQWFPLTGSNQNLSNNNKPRGEILLRLQVKFKLDNKNKNSHQYGSNSSVLQFCGRHSSSTSALDQINSSTIAHPIIPQKNSLLLPMPAFSYPKSPNIVNRNFSQSVSCITPVANSDFPSLVEEYHKLTRIVIRHELEDARETKKNNELNDSVIDWNRSLNNLSYSVLKPFHILYNISVLSEAFIQFLVIIELRYSEDYGLFKSQVVIEKYLSTLMKHMPPRTDIDDSDLTDYERTVFEGIFSLFIGHYKKRVCSKVPWFLPLPENLSSIQRILNTICTLFQLKICSNESTTKILLEETIKTRLQTDINDSFSVHSLVFQDRNDIQLNTVREFFEFVEKLAESMSIITEYQKLFASFNVNYIKTCFFEQNSAGHRVTEVTKRILKNMIDYFQKYAKPMVKATSSIYDPNLIQSSSVLLKLFLCLKRIITAFRDTLETRLLSSLPDVLCFSSVIDKMIERYESADFQQTKVTLERLISTAENEMNDVIKVIFERFATLFYVSLKEKISKYYEDEEHKKSQYICEYLDQEILPKLYGGLERVHYLRVACTIRIKALQCFRELLPLQESPDFYGHVLQLFDHLTAYFEIVCREEQHIPEQLQLLYFQEITQTRPPDTYSTNNGIIVFRAVYEVVSDLISIYVQRILNLSQLFQWDHHPLNIVHTSGAVLRLSVWDEDMVKDDHFIGECFVPLMIVESLKNRASIRDIPVSVVRLRKPNKNAQPRVYESIRNRAKIDQEAAIFIKQRTCAMESEDGSHDRATLP